MKVFAFLAYLLSFCNSQYLVGSQLDEHNCILDAGYKWCDTTQSCVRNWITPCPEVTVETPVPHKSLYCPTSTLQMCRMICPPPKCKDNECAMREGLCCDYICFKRIDTKF